MKYKIKNKNNKKERFYKKIIGLLVPLVIIAGAIKPQFGLIIFGCMFGAVLLSIYKGRLWCGKICPRGAFLDAYIATLSKNKKIPEIMKSKWFKISMIFVLVSMMVLNFIRSKGNIVLFGECMVRLLIITTLFAIILGIIYKSRAWCIICPMGTISGLIGRKNKSLLINKDSCVDCKLCNKNCSMEIKVNRYKECGRIVDIHCIKCEKCINICPKQALQQ